MEIPGGLCSQWRHCRQSQDWPVPNQPRQKAFHFPQVLHWFIALVYVIVVYEIIKIRPNMPASLVPSMCSKAHSMNRDNQCDYSNRTGSGSNTTDKEVIWALCTA
jgi:hypothetical protein